MAKKTRATAVLLILTAGAITLLLLLASLSDSAVAGPNHVAITPTITPSPSPTSVPFSATLTITTDNETVTFAEELEVTVELDVVEGCRYPVFELTLFQIGDDAPLFVHIDPPASIVGPPMTFPVTYRLRAIRPGQITLRAQTFGERNCNDYWNWRYLNSNHLPITVKGGTLQVYIPFQYVAENSNEP